MKIYIAGYFQNLSPTTLGLPLFLIRPSWMLESFHYMSSKYEQMMRDKQYTIFLDSGAFSAFTQGSHIDINKYAAYIKTNNDIIHQAASLDIIDSDSEAGTYANQKKLESLGCKVLPTHHARDHDQWLIRYLDEGYDYICLGAMVPENSEYLQNWLDHIFGSYLTNPDGTPKVKVHGFGLTSMPLMTRYSWYSVDSTAWVATSRHGAVFIDLPHGIFKIDFSARSAKRRDINSWHIENLSPDEQAPIIERLAELEKTRPKYPKEEEQLEKATGWKQGWNVKCLSEQYGWRDNFNIAFFERMSGSAPDRFIKQQNTLFT